MINKLSVAELLLNTKETILNTWEMEVREELLVARAHDKNFLLNSIPTFIDDLAKALEGDLSLVKESISRCALNHGSERAMIHHYSIEDAITEYNVLRRVIFSCLESITTIKARERDIIYEAINLGISKSASHYANYQIEQKEEASRELEKGRILLESVVKYLPIGLTIMDSKGKVISRNDEIERIIGRSVYRENIDDFKDFGGIHTDLTPYQVREYPAVRALINGEIIRNEEMLYLKPDKSISTLLTNSTPIRNSEGNIIAAVTATLDLTERKKIEAALKVSEQRLHSIIESMSEGLMIFDSKKNLIYQNPSALKMHGLVKQEDGVVLHQYFETAWLAWDEEDRPLKFEDWPVSRVFRQERFQNQILHVRRVGDDKDFYGSYNGCPIFNEKGELLHGFLTIRDITEEVTTRKSLVESEERFRLIANALPQIIWTASADFNIDWYNDWWYLYLNLPRGTRWDDPETNPMHPDDVSITHDRIQESISTGSNFEIEQRFKRGSDGIYRWHLVRGVPVKNAEGKITRWVGSNTDIHDQKMLVFKLEEERDLRERFVAALSHDLRTPLMFAKLSAQVIRKSYTHDDKLSNSTERIISSLSRVDSMIQDLLDASRLSAGEKLQLSLIHCTLSPIVHSAIDDLRYIHGNRFKIIEDGNSLEGDWDCGGIRRIIENLCNNAVKYGDPDSPITVQMRLDSDNFVNISIHNAGKPISKEDQLHLFEPYTRTASAHSSGKKGWGIGLMLVRGVVNSHGGTIKVESEEGTGTTFFVSLPVTQ